ncbi:hypothetical protein KBY86_03330 [Synechococcus sp. Lug-A]|nr:hypothetical protein [Synechococcus sp. Lug-A]
MLRIRGDRASLLAALATNWAHQQLGLTAPELGFPGAALVTAVDQDQRGAAAVAPLSVVRQRHSGDTAPAR